MIQNIKKYTCMYICKKQNKTKQKTLPVAVLLLKKKIQANIYYLHCNKHFITLDLKM